MLFLLLLLNLLNVGIRLILLYFMTSFCYKHREEEFVPLAALFIVWTMLLYMYLKSLAVLLFVIICCMMDQ